MGNCRVLGVIHPIRQSGPCLARLSRVFTGH